MRSSGKPPSLLVAMVSGLLVLALLNFVPATSFRSRAEERTPSGHIMERGDWFRVHERSDLIDLASHHGRRVRERYRPYLHLAALDSPERLITYPGSLAQSGVLRGPGPRRERQPEFELPQAFIDPSRLRGLAGMEVAIDDSYEPRLEGELAGRSRFRGRFITGHRYLVMDSPTSRDLRVFVHENRIVIRGESETGSMEGDR